MSSTNMDLLKELFPFTYENCYQNWEMVQRRKGFVMDIFNSDRCWEIQTVNYNFWQFAYILLKVLGSPAMLFCSPKPCVDTDITKQGSLHHVSLPLSQTKIAVVFLSGYDGCCLCGN